jgi:hypothetical protein
MQDASSLPVLHRYVPGVSRFCRFLFFLLDPKGKKFCVTQTKKDQNGVALCVLFPSLGTISSTGGDRSNFAALSQLAPEK